MIPQWNTKGDQFYFQQARFYCPTLLLNSRNFQDFGNVESSMEIVLQAHWQFPTTSAGPGAIWQNFVSRIMFISKHSHSQLFHLFLTLPFHKEGIFENIPSIFFMFFFYMHRSSRCRFVLPQFFGNCHVKSKSHAKICSFSCLEISIFHALSIYAKKSRYPSIQFFFSFVCSSKNFIASNQISPY